jgi:hypothetical protein
MPKKRQVSEDVVGDFLGVTENRKRWATVLR